MLDCRTDGSGTRFRVHLTPRASGDEFGGLHGGAIKIKVKAPPVDNKANKALIKLLSKKLDVPVSSLAIVAGQTSRSKTVAVIGLAPEHVRKALGL